MSHYAVLVVGDNVEKQLEPFWELDLTQADAKKDPRAEFEVEYTKEQADEYRLETAKKYPDRGYEEMTEKEFMKSFCNQEYNEEGGYGWYRNPNAKWDWFVIGGRWSGYLKAKEGCRGELGDTFRTSPERRESLNSKGFYDVLKKGEVDFEGMKKQAIEMAVEHWGKQIVTVEDLEGKGEKKKDFVKRNSGISTFAIVKDGQWYERGSMGWFGCVSDEKPDDQWEEEWNKLILNLPDDTLLTLVDCHI